MPTKLERAIAWLAPRRPEMEALLAALVEVNSHTDNVAGVEETAARFAEVLRGVAGLSVELRAQPGGRYARHLVARTKAEGAPTILVGHLDTVFRPGTFEGYRSDGARAFGPGVLDMKGGLVVMAFALRALEAAGALDRLPLVVVAVGDEEVGSPESQPLLRDLGRGAARGLVFESGRENDLVVTRRKGTGAATVTAHGRAAHAGNAHREGKNAIWALARFVDAAQRLTDYPREVTVNVGRIEGGQGKNTVPDLATALVDFRFVRSADAEATAEALHRAGEEAASSVQGTRVEVEAEIRRAAMERTDASGALLQAYCACARAAGLAAGEAPLSGGGSDGNTLASVGVPVIDALGPRGAGYHTKDEWIDLASLVPKAEAVVRLLLGSD